MEDFDIRSKVDTSPLTNNLPLKSLRKIKSPDSKVKEAKVTLISYTRNEIDVIGQFRLFCEDKDT